MFDNVSSGDSAIKSATNRIKSLQCGNNVLCKVNFHFDYFFNLYFSNCNIIGPIGAPINLLEQTVRHS